MPSITEFLESLPRIIPLAAMVALTIIATNLAQRFLVNRTEAGTGKRFVRQLLVIAVVLLGLIGCILVSPLKETVRGQLLSLLGIGLTAVIAMSSTTLVSNLMAGFMLRMIRGFRVGDFIRVRERYARVTEIGLFHTEVQTEERDLETVPNLYLVSQPIRVVRSSGTIIRADVSLGYDVPREKIRDALIEAATNAELTKPYVQVVDLGDFSVTYRAAGFLEDVKHLITARSRLRECMLDSLHSAGIEIVSPTFMNQRQLKDGRQFIPRATHKKVSKAPETTAEEVAFDKAEEVSRIEGQRQHIESLEKAISELEENIKSAAEEEKDALNAEREGKKQELESANAELERLKEEEKAAKESEADQKA